MGDLLLQSVYHAQMGRETGHFTFDSIAQKISDKMVARHPHVFGDEDRNKSAEQQTRDWEKLKAAERASDQGNGASPGALDGVAKALPALMRAQKLQKRAARVGFDWDDVSDVLAKITEECQELADARDSQDPDHISEEFGDLLFVVVNLGRHLGIEAEEALRAANAKFTRRVEGVERLLAETGKTPADSDLREMDALWDRVKSIEKSAK